MRGAALGLLSDILDKNQELDRAFDQHVDGFDVRDRAFVRMLVATTLRHLRGLDAFIDGHAQRPPEVQARHILRLGLVQLLLMQVSDHAAIAETVSLAHPKQRGFINALLRQAQRTPPDVTQPNPANIPEWLLAAWIADYGQDSAVTIANESAQQAITYISDKDGHNEPYDGDPAELHPDMWVQDAAAAKAVPVLAEAIGGLSGKKIVDACAAPGGKTMQLAAAGADVIAVDRSANRLSRLSDNLARTGLTAEVVCSDLLQWSPPTSIDAVLLDAPCSATGTIRRHPDLPWIKKSEDMVKLAGLQARLLTHVSGWQCPILYATCSLQKMEGEQQVQQFLAAHDGYVMQSEQRILPSAYNDGFYIAMLMPKA